MPFSLVTKVARPVEHLCCALARTRFVPRGLEPGPCFAVFVSRGWLRRIPGTGQNGGRHAERREIETKYGERDRDGDSDDAGVPVVLSRPQRLRTGRFTRVGNNVRA